ncbi:hypothetical protein A2U01_0072594, partial [Trifolium medium]|nr:hypothetical protein [Trifolium medium]
VWRNFRIPALRTAWCCVAHCVVGVVAVYSSGVCV